MRLDERPRHSAYLPLPKLLHLLTIRLRRRFIELLVMRGSINLYWWRARWLCRATSSLIWRVQPATWPYRSCFTVTRASTVSA